MTTACSQNKYDGRIGRGVSSSEGTLPTWKMVCCEPKWLPRVSREPKRCRESKSACGNWSPSK